MAEKTIEELESQIAELTAAGIEKDAQIAELTAAVDEQSARISTLSSQYGDLKRRKGVADTATIITVVKDGEELEINENTLANYKALGWKVKA